MNRESVMQVHFPEESPVFDGASMLMRFVVHLDGEPVVCAITVEALEDHFGARSALEAMLCGAFERGRESIRAACEDAIRETGGSVVLHSGQFRLVDE
ncbi:DUF1488 domain-containing protein [Burkholderia sp. WAC0059]|uniref:DUF1488 domain-containing protein n=1 Tax=Burkholderia sp. WAC0059 TaxID=2066022 RepID=UPI000C7F7128|nr:DUF1488 domain-containing protein [Burkholderia sp. WAC0059]PLZ02803.1 DUF1488 domain-containing protein [Burkholderia sp. WAC0059]